MKPISKELLTKGIDSASLDMLREAGEYLAQDISDPQNPRRTKKKQLSTSQIRRFFGAIKAIQADFQHSKSQIPLLVPKLAYAAGRDKHESKLDEFYQLMEPLIREVGDDEKKFKNFVNIFESIVAYHKANDGQ